MGSSAYEWKCLQEWGLIPKPLLRAMVERIHPGPLEGLATQELIMMKTKRSSTSKARPAAALPSVPLCHPVWSPLGWGEFAASGERGKGAAGPGG